MSGSAGGGGGGGGGAAGGAGAGASGAGGSGGPGGPGAAPGAAPSADSGVTKAGPVEVIDAQGNSLGQFGQDGKPTAPNVSFKPEAQKPVEDKREREPARELAEQVAKAAADPTPKPEAETARAIERRAELHEAAYLQAKQPALDAMPKEAGQAERLAELRKRDVDVVPAETAQKWAEVDARDFRKLQEQGRQEDAAVTMAEVARTNAAYRVAMAEKAPDVAERVQTLDAANTAKVEAKDDRKRAESEAMERDKIEEAKQMTPEVAAAKAKADATTYAEQKDPTEKYYSGRDMAMAAQYNKAYRESLEQVAPDVAKVVTDTDRKAANESIGPLREAANDKGPPLPTATLDAGALERVAANRAHDTKRAAEEMGLNGIEPAVERKQQQKLEGEEDAKRTAWVKKAEAAPEQPKATAARAPGDNQVSSDEVFTASKSEVKPIIPAEVEQQYLRVGDKYYHPKNTDIVAFEDKGNKLETRSNSEQVAETMVTIARARGWDEIKVSGTETFRKEVWLEAAAHGMHVKGYTPTEIDKAELAKRTRDVEANKVEPDAKFRARETNAESDKQSGAAKQTADAEAKPAAAKPADSTRTAQDQQADAERDKAAQLSKDRAQAFANKPPTEAVKEHPELAGTYAAMASMEKKAQADNLSPQQQAVVSARIRQNIVNSIERGELPQVQVREQTEVKREAKEEREMSR